MKTLSFFTAHLMFACLSFGSSNLIPDGGFESPSPLGISRGGSYFVDKIHVPDAHQGRRVLVFRCWSDTPGPVLLGPFLLDVDTLSLSVWTRMSDATPDVRITFGLFRVSDGRHLMDITTATIPEKNAWRQIRRTGVKVPVALKGQQVRLGFSVEGAGTGCTFQIDQVGLSPGNEIPSAGLSVEAEYHIVEAEKLANGTSWKPTQHTGEYARNKSSGDEKAPLLGGSETLPETRNVPAVWKTRVQTSGTYRLFIRFHHVSDSATFTAEIRQRGSAISSLTIDEGSVKYGDNWHYVWDSLDARLDAGPVEICLKRPAAGGSWLCRRIDLLILTNDRTYVPDPMDFVPPVFIRYRNTASSGQPYCLWSQIRHTGNPYYDVPGMISQAGENLSYWVPDNRQIWVGPGQSTPWVRYNSYLQHGDMQNQVQFLATRKSHVEGQVTNERIRGELQIAVGEDYKIVRTLAIDQAGPRIWVALPWNVAGNPKGIITGWDQIKRLRTVVEGILKDQPRNTPRLPIRHRNISTTLNLNLKLDDQALYAQEIRLLTDIGFNNLYSNGPDLDKKRWGLIAASHAGGISYSSTKDGCFNQPDLNAMKQARDQLSKAWNDHREDVTLAKCGDEYACNTLDHVVSCPVCRDAFKKYLRENKISLSQLGVTDWTKVVPIPHADREKSPALYYYSHLFRLDSFRQMGRLCQRLMNEQFPNAATYNNFSPALGEQTWMTYVGGNDLYMTIRNGMGMGWSEDWVGYGAGPMQGSYLLSMLRVACRPENKPYGMYVVGCDGSTSWELRVKLYEALSGGARDLCLYAYGPAYAESCDIWSNRMDRYPVLMEVFREFGRVDEELHGTVFRPADVALLYNRTAGIWESATPDNSWEMDAQFTFWALRHAGYSVDVIPEEDIEAGALNGYKALYINGRFIRRQTASTIAAWLAEGENHTLIGTAGVGAYDEYNRPIENVNALFGISSQLTKVAVAGRPRYEIRSLKSIAPLTIHTSRKDVAFNQLAWQETLVPRSSQVSVLGKNKQNEVVAVENRVGKGRAIRYAALPGLAYIQEAWSKAKPGRIPTVFRRELRDLIADGASRAGAKKVVQSSRSDLPIEYSRYDAPDGSRSVIFIINHHYDPVALTLTIPETAGVTTISSVRHGPLSFQRQGDSIILTLNLDRNTDALVLH